MANPDDDWSGDLQARPLNNSETGEDWGTDLTPPPTPVGGKAAVAQVPPGKERDWAMVNRAIARPVENILGLPGDIESLLPNSGKGGWGLTSEARAAGRFFPTGNEIVGKNLLGVENNPALEPNTFGEKFGSAALSGAVDAIPVIASGGAVLPALGTMVGSSLASEAAHQADPKSTWAPIVAGIGTALGLDSVGGAFSGWKKGKAAAEALENADTAYQAAKDAVKSVRAGVGEAKDEAGAKFDELKSASKTRLEQMKSFVSAVGEHVNGVAKQTTDWVAGKLGASTTPEEAGEVAQKRLRKWVDQDFPQKKTTLSKPIDDVMGTESLPITRLNAGLNEIPATKLTTFRNNLPPALQESFDDARELGTAMSWRQASQLRSTIGDMKKSQKIANDIGENNLDRLYAMATGDLREAAKGKGAEQLFDTYNEGMVKLHSFKDNIASKFITTTNDDKEKILPGAAANNFLKRAAVDGTEAAALRAEVPEAADALAALHLRQTGWTELSPTAKAALVPDATHRAALDSATAAQAKATVNGEDILVKARIDHQQVVDEASAGARAQGRAGRGQVRSAVANETRAENALALAQAGVPAKPNQVENLVHQVRAGAAGVVASNVLDAVWPHLPAVAKTAIIAAGYVVPKAFRMGKNLLKNPQSLITPAAGGLAGQNVLSLPQSDKPPQP